jgi:hypothetical protein
VRKETEGRAGKQDGQPRPHARSQVGLCVYADQGG